MCIRDRDCTFDACSACGVCPGLGVANELAGPRGAVAGGGGLAASERGLDDPWDGGLGADDLWDDLDDGYDLAEGSADEGGPR